MRRYKLIYPFDASSDKFQEMMEKYLLWPNFYQHTKPIIPDHINHYVPRALGEGCTNKSHTTRCYCTDKIKAYERLSRC